MSYDEEVQNELDYEECIRQEVEAQPEPDLCQTCHEAKGIPRVDGGLSAGIHCDECWDEMISSCRQRSW